MVISGGNVLFGILNTLTTWHGHNPDLKGLLKVLNTDKSWVLFHEMKRFSFSVQIKYLDEIFSWHVIPHLHLKFKCTNYESPEFYFWGYKAYTFGNDATNSPLQVIQRITPLNPPPLYEGSRVGPLKYYSMITKNMILSKTWSSPSSIIYMKQILSSIDGLINYVRKLSTLWCLWHCVLYVFFPHLI